MIKTPTILLFLTVTLTSCASWNQEPREYRYVDDGNVVILNAETVKTHDSEILNFPIYGAFSKSIYLDDEKAEESRTLQDFCEKEETVYRPVEWTKRKNIKILNERQLAHSQIKLEVEVFTRKVDGLSSVALIVFRGTDFEESEDWSSNFRWFNRFFSNKLDQYDEVRVLIPRLIEEIEEYDDSVKTFIATGHSLGGGLAQLAGYSSHKINRVIAFDSSPVTGFYDVEGGLRRFNSQNLKIYRIYEHGEVLAYIRLAMKGLYPVSKKNPDIVQVRFDLIDDESIVGQHDIKTLTCNLYKDLQKFEYNQLIPSTTNVAAD